VYKTKRQEYEHLRAQLEIERSSFLQHWRDLADYILPRRPRFDTTDVNRGDKRSQKIIDSTGTYAANTLRSGMMSGITSPARPWFKLTTPDPELSEYGPVKAWLDTVQTRMNTSMLRSNLYNTLPTVYGDLGVFGTGCMFIDEDFGGDVFSTMSIPIGSYSIATNGRGRVNVYFREFRMTVRQLVMTFGEMKNGEYDWSNFSMHVKNQWDNSNYETWVDICHVIQPNKDYDPRKLGSKYKKYISCYYERGSNSAKTASYSPGPDDDKFLRKSGYDYFPVLAPRWEVTGEDVYATMCPGMIALGDIKALQTGEKRIAQAIEKKINPPLKGPASLRTQKVSLLPGDVTYTDERTGGIGLSPVHEVNFSIQEAEAKQQQMRNRIQRAFYEDLFLMLASSDRRQITAREIDERHEEKLLALGPVLEQLNQDLLDPLIDIVFDFHIRQNLIPPPPEELQGSNLKVEYVSIMAQAQKLIGISGIERFAGFVGQVAAVSPSVLDKIDTDQLIDVYGEIVSVSPTVIRTDEDVMAIREQKQQAAQAQAKMEAMQASAGAAKDLSQTDLEGDNALNRMLQGAQAGQLVG
jgi:Bacteriophage head to tail connecting protein